MEFNEAEKVLLKMKDGQSPEGMMAREYFTNKAGPINVIKAEDILNLFNSKLAGIGKIKECPSFFMPSSVLEDFKIMSGFQAFQKIETWDNYFRLVAESKFLTQQFTPTLSWLLKSENAFKVIGGQYQDSVKGADQKPPTIDYGKAQAIASELFEKVIRGGNHGLRETLLKLDETEKKAMDIFGRASEILNCTDFQSIDIKKRLKNAVIEAQKLS